MVNMYDERYNKLKTYSVLNLSNMKNQSVINGGRRMKHACAPTSVGGP